MQSKNTSIDQEIITLARQAVIAFVREREAMPVDDDFRELRAETEMRMLRLSQALKEV